MTHVEELAEFVRRKEDFLGFFSRPASWNDMVQKFHALSERHCPQTLREEIVNQVSELEAFSARDLMATLQQIRPANT
jgi:2-methylcitrate dehydratase